MGMKLRTDLDTRSYEFFKATLDYAFILSATHIKNEVILLTMLIGPIYNAFNLSDE